MQQEQAASIAAAEIMAMRQATAHKWGEEEAAALQHLKSEHGAFRIKVGHFCGYSEAPRLGVPEEESLGCPWGFLCGVMNVTGDNLSGVRHFLHQSFNFLSHRWRRNWRMR
jgi:hypothetical protein